MKLLAAFVNSKLDKKVVQKREEEGGESPPALSLILW